MLIINAQSSRFYTTKFHDNNYVVLILYFYILSDRFEKIYNENFYKIWFGHRVHYIKMVGLRMTMFNRYP